MRTIRNCLAACAAALLLFAGGLANAAERNVTLTSWDGLRTAVANATAGDTLNVSLASDYTQLSIDGKPTITISKSLTIRSADPSTPITVNRTSVEGHGAFVVTAWAVKIQGFKFIGSDKTNAVQYEGCIRSTTGELTLKDCSFLNWDGDYRYTSEADETMAGAVTANGSKLTLDGCTFVECSIVNCTDSAGSRIQCAGAVSSRCRDTIVRNCSFVRNAPYDPENIVYRIQTGGLYVNGGDYNGNVLIADSTFGANAGKALFSQTDTSVLGTSFVNNQGPAIAFRPLQADRRLRLANALMLRNNGSDYDLVGEQDTESQILMTHTVFGSCSSMVARKDSYCAGKDNPAQWFLSAYADGTPVFVTTSVNGVDRYAYPLSAYAYAENRNVAAPLLYDGNYANPTVNRGLSMKSNPTVLWYGDTVGTSTLHTQGVDGKDCYDEWGDEYHFSCGSAMSCPTTFKFKKSGTTVATQTVMWNYGSVTMPSAGTIAVGYRFMGWDGLYAEGAVVSIGDLVDTVYISGDNELYAVIQPITYTIEYRGFNAAFDAEYHRQTGVKYAQGWVKEWTGGDIPVYGGILNCTNEAADVEAYDYACYGYTCKGWATSKERAQAGLVDYEFDQMLGSGQTGGVDLTTTDGATVTLWLVRTPNQGCVRFYSDSYKTNWVDYPAVTWQAFTVPECPFIPEPGHQFKNWSLGYEQPFKNPGDVIDVIVPAPGGVAVSFVADWETSSGYAIAYHANGGVGGDLVQSISMQYAQPQVLWTAQEAGAVSREGYTFMGWSKTEGSDNTVDYLPGRSAWGLGTASPVNLYAVWKIADGSTHIWTVKETVAGTSMDVTYVWQVIDATAKSCRLTRVIGGTAITGNWSLRDFVRDESQNVWTIVEYANTIIGDLANIPEIEIGVHVTNGVECLRYDNGKGIRQKIKGKSLGFDPDGWGYYSEDVVYFCSDDGLLFKYQDDGTYHLAAVPCNWNNANGTGLLDIPAMVTIDFLGEVGYYTVSGIAADACSALKNVNTVVIPEYIETIADDAFANNYGASPFVAGDGGISQVYFDVDDFDTSMKNWSVAFKETDWNATACQPVIRYSDNVVIGYMPCEALEDNTCTVVVPEGVSALANNAFENCAQMSAVTLPSTLEAIGEFAFNSCGNLTGVNIPATVTNVADYAFLGCTSLASLTGGTGLLGVDFSVGTGIIDGTKLQEDEDAATSAEDAYVTIGGGIGTGYDCILVYHGANDTMGLNLLPGIVGIAGGAVYNDSALYTAEIPETVRWIGAYAFDYCSNLTKIRLCVTTKTSPDFARLDRNAQGQGCAVEVYGTVACETIDGTFRVSLGQDVVGGGGEMPLDLVIGTGIRKIVGSAFAHSTDEDMQVKSVTGGADLVSVSRGAFANTTWATTEASPEPGSVATGYPHRNIGGFYVGYFGEGASMLTMPETDAVTGGYITRLSPTAFEGCSLSELTLASHLDAGQLTPEVFADQTLNALIIDPSAPNYTTDEGVLYDKDKTALLVYPREKAGDFTLPATVASISEGACQWAKIYALTIPDESALTTIPEHAFANSGVTSVTFGDRVAVIGENAFANCFSLQTLAFGKGLSRVEGSAFLQCDLRSLEFPRTLTTIGTSAFANNSYLSEMVFRGDAPQCDATAFEYGYDGPTAFVSVDSKGWNGDPTSSELPSPAVWNGLNLVRLQDTFGNWAAYHGLSGDDAAIDAKPAKWGGKYENAFVFLFGEDIVDGTKHLISIEFTSDGTPRIVTPKVISRDDSDFPYWVTVGGKTELTTGWTYGKYIPLTETYPGEPDPSTEPPEGYTYWWVPQGSEANFFRIVLLED